MRKLKTERYITTNQHNNSDKNTLGNIFKSRQQHAIISYIEVVYVYETYLNEYEMFKPTQSRQ